MLPNTIVLFCEKQIEMDLESTLHVLLQLKRANKQKINTLQVLGECRNLRVGCVLGTLDSWQRSLWT